MGEVILPNIPVIGFLGSMGANVEEASRGLSVNLESSCVGSFVAISHRPATSPPCYWVADSGMTTSAMLALDKLCLLDLPGGARVVGRPSIALDGVGFDITDCHGKNIEQSINILGALPFKYVRF